jgi:hypothetical protein
MPAGPPGGNTQARQRGLRARHGEDREPALGWGHETGNVGVARDRRDETIIVHRALQVIGTADARGRVNCGSSGRMTCALIFVILQ